MTILAGVAIGSLFLIALIKVFARELLAAAIAAFSALFVLHAFFGGLLQ